MSPDEMFLTELLAALDETSLQAIVVGTTAAALQGVPIMTQDIDLLVRDTPHNRQRLTQVCQKLGTSVIQASPLSPTLTLIGAAIAIDVVFDALPGGLEFEAVRARSHRIQLCERIALVASLDDVIASKEAAGRPKDLAQLPILRDTRKVKNALED